MNRHNQRMDHPSTWPEFEDASNLQKRAKALQRELNALRITPPTPNDPQATEALRAAREDLADTRARAHLGQASAEDVHTAEARVKAAERALPTSTDMERHAQKLATVQRAQKLLRAEGAALRQRIKERAEAYQQEAAVAVLEAYGPLRAAVERMWQLEQDLRAAGVRKDQLAYGEAPTRLRYGDTGLNTLLSNRHLAWRKHHDKAERIGLTHKVMVKPAREAEEQRHEQLRKAAQKREKERAATLEAHNAKQQPIRIPQSLTAKLQRRWDNTP